MLSLLRPAIVLLVGFTLLTGLAYPYAITGVSQLLFRDQAMGSLITRDGKVVTRHADHAILKGITRGVVLEQLVEQGLELEERAFTVEEAHGAREAFLTSASQIVIPVVQIDGRPVGNGAPGLIATALRRNFHRHTE